MAASDCTTDHPATAGEKLLELAAAVPGWLAGVWRSAHNRRSVAKLLEWDDRMLRDIGLTRGDVCAAMAVPAGKDPSNHLGELSSERRQALRAEARERAELTASAWRATRRPRPLPSKVYPFPYL